MNHPFGAGRSRRFCRDSERGIILGVCAGIADFVDCPPWAVRGAILVGAYFFPVPVIVAYLVAAYLMPERPLRYYGEGDERTLWRTREHRS